MLQIVRKLPKKKRAFDEVIFFSTTLRKGRKRQQSNHV